MSVCVFWVGRAELVQRQWERGGSDELNSV